jgi:hypothetical protein
MEDTTSFDPMNAEDFKQANQNIEAISKQVRGTAPLNDEMIPLPLDFQPGPHDVICGRGKLAWNHPGNRRFRLAVEMSIDKYSSADTKLEKSLIVSGIIESVRHASPHAGFVKHDTDGRWYIVSDQLAREKAGQCLRDLLHHKYRSSNKAKKQRRIEQHAKMYDDIDQMIQFNQSVSERIQKLAHDAHNESSDLKLVALFSEANSEILTELKRQTSECTNATVSETSVSSSGDLSLLD